MRSSSTRRLLTSIQRISPILSRPPQSDFYHAYCSSCGTKSRASKAEIRATTVASPPVPPADHRQLGVDQELFATSIYSPGSPLLLPNGARIFNKLVAFLRAQYTDFGFDEVITPTIYKKSLWEKSSHWDNYAEDMFSVVGRGASGEKEGRQAGEDEEYGLKPMNCPGHCLLFASKPRSFRELPIRYADFSPLHRNEVSGALSGLTRVRRFHQDDGHIFCRPSQVGEEISKTLDFVRLTYGMFNLGPYRLALSTRPKDQYIGTEEEWDNAEQALGNALDESRQPWSVNTGDGAFYGPKIDIILRDSDGKEHQTATIQLDFQLPKRFELEYQAPAPDLEKKGLVATDPTLLAVSGPVRPVMIHRAVLGSAERFMALLIEHYNGWWPFWLNPHQVTVLTVVNDQSVVDFAHKAIHEMQGVGVPGGALRARPMDKTSFGIDLDDSARSLKKKISEAKRKRYSIIIVVGKKNVEEGRYVTVTFNRIRDPQGIIRGELNQLGWKESQGLAEEDGELAPTGDINLEPPHLRKILLLLERAYL